mgnify:CR=1 FL=1
MNNVYWILYSNDAICTHLVFVINKNSHFLDSNNQLNSIQDLLLFVELEDSFYSCVFVVFFRLINGKYRLT